MLPPIILKLEDRFQRAVARRAVAAGRPVRAHPLPGIFLGDAVHVQGRVLVQRTARILKRGRSTRLRVLRTNVEQFITAEVPEALVRVQLGSQWQDVVADREGYFDAVVDASGVTSGEHAVTATPLEPAGEPLRTSVHVPDTAVDLVVVSDIDDTIIDSGVAHGPAAMLKAVLLADAATRVPLEGAPELYRALAKTPTSMLDRPFVYLSTSPWNLADFLTEFLVRHEFPKGSLMLTDWGPGSHGRLRISSHEHKLAALRRLATGLPNQQLLLLGDSGQADAEIYAMFAAEYPERVAAVYIRRAGAPTPERLRRLEESAATLLELGIPFLAADDSAAMLRHAVNHGFAVSKTAP